MTVKRLICLSLLIALLGCSATEVEVTRIVEIEIEKEVTVEVEIEVTVEVEKEITVEVEKEVTVEVEVTRIVEVEAEPTRTPRPTRTPEPSEATEIEPIILTGSGDDVVEIDALSSTMIAQIIGNESSRLFAIKSYDGDGARIDLLVNTTDPYQGIKLIEPETRLFEISSESAWSIEIVPGGAARRFDDKIDGTGDDVVIYEGSSSVANIEGNSEERLFAVRAYGDDGRDLLVNTTDPYRGTVRLPAGTFLFEVSATGDWSIDTE